MYCIVLKYVVSNNQEAFEKEYSRSGAWFKFFEPCEDYLGHELMKSDKDASYLLTDKWMSKEDYEDFMAENKTEHDQLNEKCKELYDEEIVIGSYEIV